MAMGKNLIDIIMRLVDQFTPGYKKAAQEVTKGSQQMTQANTQVAGSSDKAAGATKKAGEAAEEAGQKKRKAAVDTQELRQGYQQLAVVATAALIAMTMAVNRGIEANNKQVAAFTGLRSVVVGTGQDYDQARRFVEGFTEDGLIAQARAAEALKNLLMRGFSLDEAIQMLNRLKDAAAFGRQAHLDMGAAVASATEGLKNENSILVDNAGVTKNVSVMWKEYAAQLGKGVQSLTLAEKRQAEFNGIMRETRHQVGDAAKMVDTFAGQQAKAGKAAYEASAALGRAWSSALERLLPLWTSLMAGTKVAIDRYPGLTVAIMGLVGAFGALVAFAGAWATVTTPAVTAAMAAITAKAGIMWAAITGPVGIAIAALTALAAVFYHVATAQERAARAAVEAARKHEEAMRTVADAAANQVKAVREKAAEIEREEQALQDQITKLEREAAEQRAEIGRQEMERRREQANRLGDLLVSAIRKQREDQMRTEEKALEDQTAKDKAHYQERIQNARNYHSQKIDELEAWLDREKRTVADKYDELGREAEQRFRDRLAPIAAEINRLFKAEMDALDATIGGQISAKQAELDSIDKQTRDEERQLRKQERDARQAELEKKLTTLTNADEIARVKKELAEIERDNVLAERDLKKEALREEIKNLRNSYEERKQAIELMHRTEIQKLHEMLGQKKDALDQELARDLGRLSEGTQAFMMELQTRLKSRLTTISTEEQAVKASYENDLKEFKRMKDDEDTQLVETYNTRKQILDDGLLYAQNTWGKAIEDLEEASEKEKTAIHEKYFGEGGLLQETQLYADAVKLVHDNNQKDILALLDKYEPDWKNQGKDFVQRLAEGGEEAKPAVQALADGINLLLQASTENVLTLQEKASESSEQLAKINTDLGEAKKKLEEIQQTRAAVARELETASADAREAERNARMQADLRRQAEENLATEQGVTGWDEEARRRKEIVERIHRDNQAAGVLTAEQADQLIREDWAGIDADIEEEKKQAAGSRHGGGPIPVSGLYRLLQGERVISRGEAQRQERMARLIDGAGILADPSLATVSGGSAGSAVTSLMVFNFRDSKITSEQDVERLWRLISRRMLDEVRRNTTPVR